mmetsp:Transcript_4559/g.6933  ORF Transcript_4559/g.6933 Transcript_4559/m.6933 type:complete len:80 (+) Transcript_4559:40-279(+)
MVPTAFGCCKLGDGELLGELLLDGWELVGEGLDVVVLVPTVGKKLALGVMVGVFEKRVGNNALGDGELVGSMLIEGSRD